MNIDLCFLIRPLLPSFHLSSVSLPSFDLSSRLREERHGEEGAQYGKARRLLGRLEHPYRRTEKTRLFEDPSPSLSPQAGRGAMENAGRWWEKRKKREKRAK